MEAPGTVLVCKKEREEKREIGSLGGRQGNKEEGGKEGRKKRKGKKGIRKGGREEVGTNVSPTLWDKLKEENVTGK